MNDLATTLFWLRLVKLVVEIAGLAVVGQGLVYVLTRGIGQDPAANVFYRTLKTVVSPFTWVVRRITPRFVTDSQVSLAVFGLLAVIYVWTLFAIANACIGHGLTIAECRRLH